MINIQKCELRTGGVERVYTFSNNCVAVERLNYPGKSRVKYYDARGYSIRSGGSKATLESALKCYKVKMRIK